MCGVGQFDSVWAAMLAIERHFRCYPQAKDTVEGARFWCDAYGVCVSRSVVEEALRRFVKLGMVRQRTYGWSGQVVYSWIPEVEDVTPDSDADLGTKWTA